MENKRKLIIARYIFSIAVIFALLVLMFIPSYSFVTESGVNEAISLATLVSNSWEWGSECLWGTNIEQNAGNVYFSQTVVALIAVFSLLFIVGVCVTVYLSVSVLLYIKKTPKSEKNKIFVITFLFNRIIAFVLQLMVVPIFVFPRILPSIYLSALNVYVEIRWAFIDPLIIVLVLYIIGAVLSVISAKYERLLDVDIFGKIKSDSSETETNEKDKSTLFSNDRDMTEEEISIQSAKKEQAEKILKMLNKNNEDKKDK